MNILKALYDYYQNDPEHIPYGWKYERIRYIIVIDSNGKFKYVEESIDKKFLVPDCIHKSGKTITPLLMFDNAEYVLNLSMDGSSANNEKHQAFKDRCKHIAESSNEPEFIAVSKFYENKDYDELVQSIYWNDIKETVVKSKNTTLLFSFRVHGQNSIVAENEKLLKYNVDENEPLYGTCLVTGKYDELIRLSEISIFGGNSRLVSFNSDCFCSYDKKQCENSPISKNADFAIKSAVQKLKETNRNTFWIGKDNLYIFWTESKDKEMCKFETELYNLFNYNSKNDSDDVNIEDVKDFFKSIYSGAFKTNHNKNKFYLIGVSINVAREYITYHNVLTIDNIAENVYKYISDMELIGTQKYKKPYMGIYSILTKLSPSGKISNNSLIDDMFNCIFNNKPVSRQIVTMALDSVLKLKKEESYKELPLLSILKTYINRNNLITQKISIMLNKENNNIGYLCGRLYAVCSRVQYIATGSNKLATNLSGVCIKPRIINDYIQGSTAGNIAKIKEKGGIKLNMIISEIISKMNDIPERFTNDEKVQFTLGYYHQREDFYNDREKNQDEDYDN